MNRIVGVAIVFGTEVWIGHPPDRHHTLIHRHFAATGKRGSGFQGFIDSTGQFLDRREALHVAREADQLIDRPGRWESDELFSEDLW